ncbi:response regulator [Limimaricola hongkongensis]|uniref:Putative sensory transduction regulatory protein n=1 Tax=Limimaricola hongkongensis DSM 17492 TaxID=1122180 RepID=A0A017HCM1_9RHOB|nr:response regulator [Limimaricola hongkongensis]EYD72257.1 putative sensory transduction regulatory protein [Limimaricola hongkongensis DSM 17492]
MDETLQGIRVLFVEDESLVAMLGEDVLSEAGCEVTVAMRLSEALRAAEEIAFDVAILDVNLGNETSYPVAERLARDNTPFIFATGYAAAGLPGAFAAHRCVQKPYDPDQLLAAARAALRG